MFLSFLREEYTLSFHYSSISGEDQVQSSELPELQSFAAGVEKDKDAVRAGLTWWISNGMVEGYVNKLKLIRTTEPWQGRLSPAS